MLGLGKPLWSQSEGHVGVRRQWPLFPRDRALRPSKFASNRGDQGTADENKAAMQGLVAHFGTYSIALPKNETPKLALGDREPE